MVSSKKNRSGSETQFPGKLHDMMKFVEARSLETIISWELNGHGIKINNPDRLVEILPLFFGQTKYRSFRRQLNMWHFQRILEGPNKGVFVHPYFVKHLPNMCSQMSRQISFKPTFPKQTDYDALSSCIEPDPIKETTSLDTKILTAKLETRDLLPGDYSTQPRRSSQDFFKLSSICLPSSGLNSSSVLPPLPGRPAPSFDATLQLLNSIFADEELNIDEQNDPIDLSDGDLVCFEGKRFFFLDNNTPELSL
mmetsp:Transcript_92721/g.139094  ORF Transcript_92721/g.139094 Transcript_92721/m.139094 type:complete len:252 (+) Transcript_92721:89-844(+)